MKKKYDVIGLMSGTSLDGLDIAFCTFTSENGNWKYTIHAAETISYPSDLAKRLSSVENGTALEIAQFDADYGHYLGKQVNVFLEKYNKRPDFIASHGHTIFHRPEKKMTLQIGKGSAIAAETGLTVINDFRVADVALGGQGAPLVPVGDRLLFGNFDFCLNIGGFANISYEKDGARVAFDVCPANIVLNAMAQKRGKNFDCDGELAVAGHIDVELLDNLDSLPYYSQSPPKSLGKEWVVEHFNPVIERSTCSVEDKLNTLCVHIAKQIGNATPGCQGKSLLVTGGGACNKFLVSMIRSYMRSNVIIPDTLTIHFKEALIFAFLGVLRLRNEVNTLSSVTGSRMDHSGGAIWPGNPS